MTARKTLLTALFALGLSAATAVGQPPEKREVTPDQIEGLRQQLSMLSQLQGMNFQGMKPEEQQRLLDQFKNFQNNDALKKWAEQFKMNGGNPPPVPPPAGIDPPGNPEPIPPPRPNGQGRQRFGVGQAQVIPEAPGVHPPLPGVPQPPVPQPELQPPVPLQPQGPLPNGRRIGVAMPNMGDGDNPAAFGPKANGNPNPNAAEAMKFWEKNFGPLERTPAVRDAILELFAQGKGGDFDFGDWKDLLDEFNKNGQGDEGFGDWLKDLNLDAGGEKWDWGGGGWDFPKWNWGGGGGNNNWGGNNGGGGGWNWGGGGWGGGGTGGGGGTWLPVILLVVFAVGGLLLWKFWPLLARRPSAAEAGVRALNRWPVDPRTINSREELVKAFEYLSVLLCGDAARVWNHETIARALRAQIPHSDLVADELAKLYELARYTPPGEPLPPSALADARRCLCHLAGVTA